MWPYDVPHRGVGPHAEGYFGRSPFTYSATFGGPDRRRALYRCPGQRLLLVSIAYPRRPHEPLRPRHPAVRRLRLQADGTRRPGCRLADRLRRSRTVLRQGRDVHRGHWHEGRHPQRARRYLQSTGPAARARRARATFLRKARHPCSPRPAGRHHRFRATDGRRATTAVNAVAGCKTASNYASSYVQIFPAMQHGSRHRRCKRDGARARSPNDTGKVVAVVVHRQDDRQ